MEIRFGPTTRLPEDHCPVCRHRLDAASIMTDPEGKPQVGNFSICINCAATLRFGIGMRLEMATKEDLRELYDNAPERFAAMGRLIATVQLVIMDRRRKGYRRN